MSFLNPQYDFDGLRDVIIFNLTDSIRKCIAKSISYKPLAEKINTEPPVSVFMHLLGNNFIKENDLSGFIKVLETEKDTNKEILDLYEKVVKYQESIPKKKPFNLERRIWQGIEKDINQFVQLFNIEKMIWQPIESDLTQFVEQILKDNERLNEECEKLKKEIEK